ncbi:uncharacterized protein BDW43DRAFT_277016 [Aspergillus alliaceus]|uniref:uncharacterized protein n=1 Tax=Petromyces alliaceus TaxID=209559 RepID=UPI0012A472F3|nr:uncharacterized protein BDW43DRAFT_277016 [Aspergillus alliaceus]KAB8233333.1 hypothetical protein BDW43DRAFT_277016 [Aspergillus alliaceus]
MHVSMPLALSFFSFFVFVFFFFLSFSPANFVSSCRRVNLSGKRLDFSRINIIQKSHEPLCLYTSSIYDV